MDSSKAAGLVLSAYRQSIATTARACCASLKYMYLLVIRTPLYIPQYYFFAGWKPLWDYFRATPELVYKYFSAFRHTMGSRNPTAFRVHMVPKSSRRGIAPQQTVSLKMKACGRLLGVRAPLRWTARPLTEARGISTVSQMPLKRLTFRLVPADSTPTKSPIQLEVSLAVIFVFRDIMRAKYRCIGVENQHVSSMQWGH